MTTVAPCFANSIAMPRPIPLSEPVTRTTLLSNCILYVLPFLFCNVLEPGYRLAPYSLCQFTNSCQCFWNSQRNNCQCRTGGKQTPRTESMLFRFLIEEKSDCL